jgi:hypothetical protein
MGELIDHLQLEGAIKRYSMIVKPGREDRPVAARACHARQRHRLS